MTLSLKLRVSHRFSFRSKNTKFMTNTFQRGLCFSKRNGFPHRQFSIAFRGGHISFSVAHACRAARLRAAAPFLQICNAYGVMVGTKNREHRTANHKSQTANHPSQTLVKNKMLTIPSEKLGYVWNKMYFCTL